jgi:hypothetical protein
MRANMNSDKADRVVNFDLVGTAGFEPATPTPPVWCATRLRYAPNSEPALYLPCPSLQVPCRVLTSFAKNKKGGQTMRLTTFVFILYRFVLLLECYTTAEHATGWVIQDRLHAAQHRYFLWQSVKQVVGTQSKAQLTTQSLEATIVAGWQTSLISSFADCRGVLCEC